jgi:hypothetical protein
MVTDMNQLPYLVAMDQMQSGDFIQVRGTSTISDIIMSITAYSHSMGVIRYPRNVLPHYPNDRVYVVESTVNETANGLQVRNFRERFLKDHDHGAEWFWIRTNLSQIQRVRAREFYIIETAKGIPYDFKTLFLNLLGYMPFGFGKYICSEVVFACMIAIGAYKGDTTYAPRPGDLDVWLSDIIVDTVQLIGPKPNEAIHATQNGS